MSLLGTTGLYVHGSAELGTRRRGPWPLVRRRRLAFAVGMLALVVALVSPVDALGSALFACHMTQHMLLMLVAAPFLAISAPIGPLLLSLPPHRRVALGRFWKGQPGVRHLCTMALQSGLLGAA